MVVICKPRFATNFKLGLINVRQVNSYLLCKCFGMGLLDVKHTLSSVSCCLAKISLLFGNMGLVWENVRKFMLTKVGLSFLFINNEARIAKFYFIL